MTDVRVSTPVDGFRLAYDRIGAGPPVVLLHGWPGDRHDFRRVLPLLTQDAELFVPDLRGFGESDKHRVSPAEQYSAEAQARSIIGLVAECGIPPVVLAGYDVGSRVAQAVAQIRPDLVRALVISPPLPGVGKRILSAESQRQFWYQPFHQSPLVEALLDGRLDVIRAYIGYFWHQWSGPGYRPESDELDRLSALYAAPGAMVASINYYRAGAGTVAQSLAAQVPAAVDRIAAPTVALWPDSDALYPAAWADQLGSFFADVDLQWVQGSGHFTPLEVPDIFADHILRAIDELRAP